jgi:SulP family sulfate permease
VADDEDEINQPGLGSLRTVLETAKRRVPSGRTVVRDGTAGLTTAVGSVPDGMANALLAGVNPVFGLYANIAAPIAGGLLASSALMVINSTSAGAIVAGQSMGASTSDRGETLFLLVVVAGLFQLVFGLLKLGRLTRYISYSVMTGFVSGLAVVLALSQLPTVTGMEVPEGSTLADAVHVLTHLADVQLLTVLVAAVAAVITPLASRVGLGRVAALLAIVVPSVGVAVLGVDVAVIGDTGQIASGLPTPSFPSLSNLSVELLTGALALSVVVLVQGTGVSQSISSSQGEHASISRDFVAQGAANVVSGLTRGLPVGGSFKGTAISASAGARGRWAAIFSGIWMLLIVVAFSGLVSDVAMPALGGLLVYLSTKTIKPAEVRSVWRAGGHARLAGAVTFVATIALPIQFAILVGVVLAAFLYISGSSTDLAIVELVERDDGTVEERENPDLLRSGDVTVLDIYGHLFYAGANRLGRLLPSPAGVDRPAVVIRLRGRTAIGATVADVLADYAEQVTASAGQLYLTGLGEEPLQRLLRERSFRHTAGVHLYVATTTLGESTRQAVADARRWLAGDP